MSTAARKDYVMVGETDRGNPIFVELLPGLADRIEEARRYRGIARARLSTLAERGQSHVGQIERGVVTRPKDATIVEIARALKVGARWLCSGQGAMSSRKDDEAWQRERARENDAAR